KTIKKDAGYTAFSQKNASSGGALMFGKTTYDIMKTWWPTDVAKQADPVMADAMNKSKKYVFSLSMTDEDKGAWKDTHVIRGVDAGEIRRLKAEPGPDIVVLGSGSIVQQLTNLGLIDSYTLVVVPLVLGKGKLLFENCEETQLALKESTKFDNGLLVNRY